MGIPRNLAKAKRLAIYWDNYVQYLSTLDDRQPNVGNGKAKPPQIILYTKPFADDLVASQYLKATATQARWNAYKSSFTGYVKPTLAAADSLLKITGYRAAKVVITTGLSTTATVKTAKTTKRKYASHGGESGGIAFGRKTATETEIEAYSAIVAGIKGTGFNPQTTRVSRIKEKY